MSLTSDSAILRVLEASRRKLLETGTRNRLVHVNRANARSNSINIVNEKSDEVFMILRNAGKRMRFKAMGHDRAKSDEPGAIMLSDFEPDEAVDENRHKDDFLETSLGPEAQVRRLLRMAKDARTAEEEQGLNILFLAIGFLKWKESASSEIVRESPLILLPVDLVRNERTSTYDLKAREDDITTNLPLRERLRQDFGVILPEIDESEDWIPSTYFDLVMEAVSGQQGWSVDQDGIQLGFFSFAKLLMHHDLNLESWPEGTFEGNDLLNGLLLDGFEHQDSIFPDDARLDEILDPSEIIQVVDADASQTKVIEEVRRGINMVVQGPPGTGKSQTITNILAAAAHDGKTVLFVAEKMAALSVVHSRLVKCGLKDLCLELHSRTANKKAVSLELGRTLSATGRSLPSVDEPHPLRERRNELNRIAAMLHAPLNQNGDTPFEAIGEIIGFIGSGASPASIGLEGLEKLGPAERRRGRQALEKLTAVLKEIGNPNTHPFKSTRALNLQPTDLRRLEVQIEEAIGDMDLLALEGRGIAETLSVAVPNSLSDVNSMCTAVRALADAPSETSRSIDTLFDLASEPRLKEALAIGSAWSREYRAAANIFSASAWSTQTAEMRRAIVSGKASIFQRWFGGYRRASAELASVLNGPLPSAPADRLALVDQMIDVQQKRAHLAEEENWLQTNLKEHWRGERTSFAELLPVCEWLASVRNTGAFERAHQLSTALGKLGNPIETADGLRTKATVVGDKLRAIFARLEMDISAEGLAGELMDVSLADARQVLARMLAEFPRYADWVNFKRTVENAWKAGTGEICDNVLNGALKPDQAVEEFLYACAEARWDNARRANPQLDSLRDLDRHNLVVEFSDLESQRITDTQNLVRLSHSENVPRGTAGEMGIIRGEIGRKRGHKSIRWLMKNAGSMVQRIKPVMLMSPISVAQYLPAGAVEFDLLVIDEASQIRPEDALGCIARARQVVVVGDQQQLPPTSFFDRLVDDSDTEVDEDEGAAASAADMESILTLFETRGVNKRMLSWHYRSRDPSLIRVSNAEFYEDGLVLPPSPLQLDKNYGLMLRGVPGVYAPKNSGLGRAGTNRIEAEAIASAVADHARKTPSLSLGIAAFSKAQSDMITEVLENSRRKDAVLDAFLQHNKAEDVFVKNIENVQGDERDVIFISVGYGPQVAGGRLTNMSFGPINGEGGGRRLNVLFSRARSKCEVFISFDPADIDSSRSSRDGPRILKRFLEFAKTGLLDEKTATGLGADSPFEEDVAKVIQALGYEADPQVGSSGFRIDLGVRHPDRPAQYILAVECDGATYHSALWARERDRLRQEVLEGLGWRFHRVWSTDWFHRREREIERLSEALTEAKAIAESGFSVHGANDFTPIDDAEENEAYVPQQAEISLHHLAIRATPYVKAELIAKSTAEPHEVSINLLAGLVEEIVAIEGPLRVEEVARRISAAFGKSRTGSRIIAATEQAITAATRRNPDLIEEANFVFTKQQRDAPPIRNRSEVDGYLLRAEFLPPFEITAAAELILQESGGMVKEELVRTVANLLGFQRVGPDLSRSIGDVLDETIEWESE
jgi:hypothetical protein